MGSKYHLFDFKLNISDDELNESFKIRLFSIFILEEEIPAKYAMKVGKILQNYFQGQKPTGIH